MLKSPSPAALLCALCVGLFSAGAGSQTPVEVNHQGDDSTGHRLGYALKEAIRGSNSMTLSFEDVNRIEIKLFTLDASAGSTAGIIAAYSATWVFHSDQLTYPLYLKATVGLCGEERISSCAERLAAHTDNVVIEFNRVFPGKLKTSN